MRFLRPSAGRGYSANASTGAARAQALSQRSLPWHHHQQLARRAVSTQQLELEVTEGLETDRMEASFESREGYGASAGAGDAQPPAEPAQGVQQQQQQQQQRGHPMRTGGALSLAAPHGKEQEVPRTLPHALAVFLTHPSVLLIICSLLGLAAWRAQLPSPTAADAAVAACVVAGWCVQEWVIHAFFLHSSFDWVGRRIHVGHHQRPYFHVSIDDPPIVLSFMAASLAAFWLGFGGSELAVTAALAYFSMGLTYEFTHYIVHTRYMPRSRLGKRIRMHHLLHHTRNEAYWLAFTAPQVDKLFGTSPEPGGVRMSDMAKASLKSRKEAA